MDRGLVTSFMPGSATFLPHLTVPLPAEDAIAGVEAWRAGGIWRSAEWALLASGHHHVPGRRARRTWLRVQLPAGIQCGYVGSFMGRRRQAENLLGISMVASGVPPPAARTPDLCVTNHGVGPTDGARASSRQIVAAPFFKTFAAPRPFFARIGAALGLPAVWMASLRQN